MNYELINYINLKEQEITIRQYFVFNSFEVKYLLFEIVFRTI